MGRAVHLLRACPHGAHMRMHHPGLASVIQHAKATKSQLIRFADLHDILMCMLHRSKLVYQKRPPHTAFADISRYLCYQEHAS